MNSKLWIVVAVRMSLAINDFCQKYSEDNEQQKALLDLTKKSDVVLGKGSFG
jgi:hypothetical protein